MRRPRARPAREHLESSGLPGLLACALASSLRSPPAALRRLLPRSGLAGRPAASGRLPRRPGVPLGARTGTRTSRSRVARGRPSSGRSSTGRGRRREGRATRPIRSRLRTGSTTSTSSSVTRSLGLDVLLTIWGTPGWANGGAAENVAPHDARDLRDFAHALAARYSGLHPGSRSSASTRSGTSRTPRCSSARSSMRPAGRSRRACTRRCRGRRIRGHQEREPAGARRRRARPPLAGHDRRVAALHDGESPARFAQLVAAAAPGLRFDAWAHHPYPRTDLSDPRRRSRGPPSG